MPKFVLFYGHKGRQKTELLQHLARIALCRQDPSQAARLACNCYNSNLCASSQHPDLWQAPSTSLSSLRIEHAIELQEHLRLHAVHGKHRVAIIADMERFNGNATNKLLKVLEEPPPDTLILASSSQKDALLPTVLSRAVQWPVPPLSFALFDRLWTERAPEILGSQPITLSPEQRQALARISAGSWDTAITLVKKGPIISELCGLLTEPDYAQSTRKVLSFTNSHPLSPKELITLAEISLSLLYRQLLSPSAASSPFPSATSLPFLQLPSLSRHSSSSSSFIHCQKRRQLLSSWHRAFRRRFQVPLHSKPMLYALVAAGFEPHHHTRPF